MSPHARRTAAVALCAAVGCTASDSGGSLGGAGQTGPCGLDDRYLALTAAPKDAIRSIDEPIWVDPDPAVDRWYPSEADHLIGFFVDGQPYAVPVNMLWYHEIVNATFSAPEGTVDLAITHCPLTGTSIVFDRAPADGAEMGVSGVLYRSNLVMYDRNQEESWWPQMLGAARCGSAEGTELPLYRFIEMRWDGWLELHPSTKVLESTAAGLGGYDINPYAGYDAPDSGYTFPMPPLDPRLPPKARVLGVANPAGPSWVFPFTELETRGAYAAITHSFGAGPPAAVVFWDATREAAAAYHREVNETMLSFGADEDGLYDVETGSRWSVDGLAVAGPLAGERLEPVRPSYVGFWGAWAAFFDLPRIWGQLDPVIPT